MSTTSSTGVARWGMIGLTGLILTFADADAQQQPQTSPPNPYRAIAEFLVTSEVRRQRLELAI